MTITTETKTAVGALDALAAFLRDNPHLPLANAQVAVHDFGVGLTAHATWSGEPDERQESALRFWADALGTEIMRSEPRVSGIFTDGEHHYTSLDVLGTVGGYPINLFAHVDTSVTPR